MAPSALSCNLLFPSTKVHPSAPPDTQMKPSEALKWHRKGAHFDSFIILLYPQGKVYSTPISSVNCFKEVLWLIYNIFVYIVYIYMLLYFYSPHWWRQLLEKIKFHERKFIHLKALKTFNGYIFFSYTNFFIFCSSFPLGNISLSTSCITH